MNSYEIFVSVNGDSYGKGVKDMLQDMKVYRRKLDMSRFWEKVQLFSHDFLKCCLYLCEVEPSRQTFTKKLYSELISSSKLLEDFLDFHGAKNNKEWYYYRELVASARNLSAAAYIVKHIFTRFPSYGLDHTENFQEEGLKTHKFLTTALRRISAAALTEANSLNIQFPEDRFCWDDFPGIYTSEILDYNIDDKDTVQEKRNLVKIATEFIKVSREFDSLGFYEPCSTEEMKVIVPEKINEEEMRRFEMIVHNMQSSFDTYVNRSGQRFENTKLKQMRGFISVVLHLMDLCQRLLHYYERHLYEVGYKNIYKVVRDRLAKLISPEDLMDRTVNYCLFNICQFLTRGQALAKEVLNENIERSSIKVAIPEKMGFHCRPSLLVAKIVQHYGGEVELCIGSDRFDASSVLDLQWAGGKIQKENIKDVVFEGDTRALRDIEILASVNYGEDAMGKGIPLPKELNYLKH